MSSKAIVLTEMKAASINQHLASISELFMAAGRKCPLNTDFGAIYSDSKRLQSALCEYTILIIGLCKEVVRFLKKSAIEQSALVMVKLHTVSVFAEYQKKLEDQMQMIRDEVLCASSVLQRDTAVQISAGSKLLGRLSDELAQHLEYQREIVRRKARLRFLDSCSRYDYQIPLKQARRRGSVRWFLSNEAYISWKQQTKTTLWCSGILGSGKSVLTANVIHDLLLSQGHASVAYFFCRHEDRESLQSETVIRSISRQIFQTISMDFEKLKLWHDMPEEDQLLVYMRTIPRSSTHYYIVIDGLDECEESDVQSLLSFLSHLMDSLPNAHIYCASRPELLFWASRKFQSNHLLNMTENNTEINDYITNTLIECLESGRLSLGNEAIIVNITESLLSKAEGMFLWVALQIDSICAQNSDESIIRTLEDLPRGLPATFARILRKAELTEYGDPILANKIFMIIDEAQRPLTSEELREAISVEPGDLVWKPETVINDVDKALKSCSSLVVVDEDERTVHFAHSSVRQYLHQEVVMIDLPGQDFTPRDLQVFMGNIILTYLNYHGKFETQIAKASSSKEEIQTDSPKSLVDHLVPDSKLASNVGRALLYLRSKGEVQRDFRQQLVDVPHKLSTTYMDNTDDTNDRGHAFLAYAKKFWFFHSRALELATAKVNEFGEMFDSLVGGDVKVVTLPWAPENYMDMGPKFLDSVSSTRHWFLIHKILQGKAENRLAIDSKRFHRWLGSLPEHDPPFDVEHIYSDALHIACSMNDASLVDELFIKGANVNVQNNQKTALEIAAFDGDNSTAERLLSCGANPNLKGPLYDGALNAAVAGGHETTVRLLLDFGCDVDQHPEALDAAKLSDHKAIQDLLHDKAGACEIRLKAQRGILQ